MCESKEAAHRLCPGDIHYKETEEQHVQDARGKEVRDWDPDEMRSRYEMRVRLASQHKDCFEHAVSEETFLRIPWKTPLKDELQLSKGLVETPWQNWSHLISDKENLTFFFFPYDTHLKKKKRYSGVLELFFFLRIGKCVLINANIQTEKCRSCIHNIKLKFTP